MPKGEEREDFVDRMKEAQEPPISRYWTGAPPAPSKVSGLPANGPFCPFMVAKIGIPTETGRIIGGQKAVSLQMQQAPMPCLGQTCLFWDRWSEQCGFTTLLDTMLNGEEEVDVEEQPAENEAANG